MVPVSALGENVEDDFSASAQILVGLDLLNAALDAEDFWRAAETMDETNQGESPSTSLTATRLTLVAKDLSKIVGTLNRITNDDRV